MYVGSANRGTRIWCVGSCKEGVLLRNVSAAPICDHFTVVAPGCWMREPVPFLTWPFSVLGEWNNPSIVVMSTWVRILQMKVSIVIGSNNYTKMSLLLELHIYSQPLKKYKTINGHSLPNLFPSSSIPPPGKWSDRTKEAVTFLTHTPSLVCVNCVYACITLIHYV